MARVLLETLNGVGTVRVGEVELRTTRYRLSIWSNDGAGGPDPVSDGSAVDGHIDITGIEEAVVLAGPDSLTLTLEDGRRLAFRLTSSSGGLVGRAWLQTT